MLWRDIIRSMPTIVPPPTEERVDRTSRLTAGVSEYSRMGYWQPDYIPKSSDILCAFRITPQPGVEPIEAAAMPLDGVVREGDGSMTVWVTSDGHSFTQRQVRLGLQDGGYDQVLDGVSPGDRVVVKGAIILDNMVNGGES